MKKLLLILLLLIITATGAYATELPDDLDEDNPIDFEEDILSKYEADDTTIDFKEEKLAKDAKEDTSIKDSSTDDKKDTLSEVDKINLIENDEQKIKKWAELNSEKNYLIINKKYCSASVYNKEGKEINRFEIGIGKDIGDDFNDTRGILGKPKNTTPAGEYTLITNIFNKSAYGDLTLSLGSKANKSQSVKKMVALHKIPKFRLKDRANKFYDGDLANNRMSHGCINFIEEDFKELTKYIRGGFKTYILPEEKDNKLILTKNDKGQFEFTQTKY